MDSAHSLDRVLALVSHPWAIQREALAVIASVVARRISAGTTEPFDRPPMPPPRRAPASGSSSVAVIPIHGTICPRITMLSDMSGGTSFHAIRNQLNDALRDPSVSTIVLDIDSPGGSCAGASECASAIRLARQRKPIIACIEYTCCSAAYWLAANATQIIAAPSAMVGSIGVFTIHEDLSKALEQLGVTVSVISAGKYKTEGHPTAPLSADARARLQHSVDSCYGRFVADIAAGRGVSAGAVRTGFGEGAVVDADQALRLGMVNAIGTLEETQARLTTTPTLAQQPTSPIAASRVPARAAATSGRLASFQQQQQARALGARHIA